MDQLEQILELPIGTKIKILGISETNEEVDDILVLLEKPVFIGDELIVYVEMPSGITRHVETPIELIDDIFFQ
jgi:hypothetical protein